MVIPPSSKSLLGFGKRLDLPQAELARAETTPKSVGSLRHHASKQYAEVKLQFSYVVQLVGQMGTLPSAIPNSLNLQKLPTEEIGEVLDPARESAEMGTMNQEMNRYGNNLRAQVSNVTIELTGNRS